MTANPAFDGKAQSVGGYIDDKCSPYICPLIGLEMNDRSKFCFLWKCGCVMSERGLNLGADNKCVNCVAEYEDDDIVILNPTKEDILVMRNKLTKRKDKIKSKKNKVKLEAAIKEEPVDDVKDEKPIIEATASVKTENINVKVEVKKEENCIKSEFGVKKEKSKRMYLYLKKNVFTLPNYNKLYILRFQVRFLVLPDQVPQPFRPLTAANL